MEPRAWPERYIYIFKQWSVKRCRTNLNNWSQSIWWFSITLDCTAEGFLRGWTALNLSCSQSRNSWEENSAERLPHTQFRSDNYTNTVCFKNWRYHRRWKDGDQVVALRCRCFLILPDNKQAWADNLGPPVDAIILRQRKNKRKSFLFEPAQKTSS